MQQKYNFNQGITINIQQTRLTLIVAATAQLIIQLIANMTVVALPKYL